MDLDRIRYWTELSDYDLDTADAMLRTGRLLYVGYMCHQTIEKIFKAYWCSRKEEPAPYSHNLINLAQSCGLAQLLSSEQKIFIGEMMPLTFLMDAIFFWTAFSSSSRLSTILASRTPIASRPEVE